MELILTTPEALAEIVEQAVQKCQRKQNLLAETISARLNLQTAVDFLNQEGFPISASKLYKLTAEGKIPHQKFGHRLVFDRGALAAWAEAQLRSRPDGTDARTAIARSARKRDKH